MTLVQINLDDISKWFNKSFRYFWLFRNSQFRDEYSLDQISNAPMIYEPLTKLQCCPTSDGSAAAILASEQFVIDNNLQEKVCPAYFY